MQAVMAILGSFPWAVAPDANGIDHEHGQLCLVAGKNKRMLMEARGFRIHGKRLPLPLPLPCYAMRARALLLPVGADDCSSYR